MWPSEKEEEPLAARLGLAALRPPHRPLLASCARFGPPACAIAELWHPRAVHRAPALRRGFSLLSLARSLTTELRGAAIRSALAPLASCPRQPHRRRRTSPSVSSERATSAPQPGPPPRAFRGALASELLAASSFSRLALELPLSSRHAGSWRTDGSPGRPLRPPRRQARRVRRVEQGRARRESNLVFSGTDWWCVPLSALPRASPADAALAPQLTTARGSRPNSTSSAPTPSSTSTSATASCPS